MDTGGVRTTGGDRHDATHRIAPPAGEGRWVESHLVEKARMDHTGVILEVVEVGNLDAIQKDPTLARRSPTNGEHPGGRRVLRGDGHTWERLDEPDGVTKGAWSLLDALPVEDVSRRMVGGSVGFDHHLPCDRIRSKHDRERPLKRQ
jgi:hypothetical protein